MKTGGLLGIILENWANALLICLVLFGIYSATIALSPEDLDNIAFATNTSFTRDASVFAQWGVTLTALTPTYRYDLPFTDKYIIGINDLPYPDAMDFIIIIPLLLMAKWLLRRVRLHPNKVWHYFYMILIFIGIIMVGYIIAKLFFYYRYIWASNEMGINKAQAISIREEFLRNIENFSTFILIMSGFSVGAIYKVFKR